MKPLAVYIGFDPREPVAYHVLSHSILRRARGPVAIIPLARTLLTGCFTRPRGPTESTDFSISRFLVPYLSDYEGVSVFMDSDMLVRTDLWDLLAYPDEQDPSRAVWVVQHDYTPTPGPKFLGAQQTAYVRKNWSSLIVWNNAECKALTPEYVNAAPGLDLHRFAWLPDDMIGSLPREWNWLVGEPGYPYNPLAKILHFTRGGPYFPEFAGCDHADEWRLEKRLMEHAG